MPKDIAELIKLASEAAKAAPEHLQEAAFNKAFDALQSGEPGSSNKPNKRSNSRKTRLKKNDTDKKSDVTAESLDSLNRTEHAEIHYNDTALNNSLRLLRAAKNELGIDGLSSAEIAKTLTEKFRCSVSPQRVGQVLNGAGQYVDRRKDGSRVVFRIMEAGEDLLDSPPEKDESTTPKASRRKKRKKTKKKKINKKTARKKTKKKSASKVNKKTGVAKVGAHAALGQLYEKGFFNTRRTVGAITSHLKHNHGRTFKSNEMSPSLLRYLRDEKLSREKNDDGQYEYFQS